LDVKFLEKFNIRPLIVAYRVSSYYKSR